MAQLRLLEPIIIKRGKMHFRIPAGTPATILWQGRIGQGLPFAQVKIGRFMQGYSLEALHLQFTEQMSLHTDGAVYDGPADGAQEVAMSGRVEQQCKHCGGSGLEPDNKAIGIAMRQKRQAAGLSGREVARLLRFSPAYISDLELGRRAWSKTLRTRYLEALDHAASRATGGTP